ncbi:MAG TPA: hypothetical protein VFR97_09260 [Capillimicrobium sp.]|nr:hypothetical protein [Capillimicrobium sp.]
MSNWTVAGEPGPQPRRFLLHHRHQPHECSAAFAAWKGHASPLRHRETFGTCRRGEHAIWWLVRAAGADEALALLPHFVAVRTTAIEVGPIAIP